MDEKTQQYLARVTEVVMTAVLELHADPVTTLGLVSRASSFLRLLCSLYQQRDEQEFAQLVTEWAASQDDGACHELLSAPTTP